MCFRVVRRPSSPLTPVFRDAIFLYTYLSSEWEMGKGLQVLRSKVKVQITGREIIIIINEYH